MPTVKIIGPYRFFFFSDESEEPPHIHVERDSCLAKFWLDTVSLARADGFRAVELRTIESLVARYRGEFLGAWYAHFSE